MRAAIVGTAETWAMVPWADSGLKIFSLNDAYRLKGFVRADGWYDFHPLNRFFAPPVDGQPVYQQQIPTGYYARPADHLAWLGRQASTIPVSLHPGYREQHPPAAEWPKAFGFPKAEIEAAFGRYFTSSPAWMMAHLMMQGVKELTVTGIHLATEFEYVRQRPNWEFLCGRFLGTGHMKVSVKDGFRHYETQRAHLILPVKSPVLQENFQYAFDPRPDAALAPLQWDVHRFSVKRERAVAALRQGTGRIPAEVRKIDEPLAAALDERPWRRTRALRQLLKEREAWLADAQDVLGRAQAMAAENWRSP